MGAPAGWFPDPGGQAGMYRYWDGRQWSAALSPTPQAPAVDVPQAHAPPPRPSPPRPWAWILGLAAVLVALVLVIALVVTRLTGGPTDPSAPGGQASTPVCPPEESVAPQPQPGDGRVHGGRLSYPQLGSPWSAPEPEYGVAFGRGVLIQSVETERNGNQPWLAAVLVGQLMAGDGFFTPEQGAAIVVTCVIGTFYGGSDVTRADRRNRALEVDGYDAWLIESQLSFEVPGIQARSELLILVVVDTGDGSAGLFYASIPENAPQLVSPARASLAALKVDD